MNSFIKTNDVELTDNEKIQYCKKRFILNLKKGNILSLDETVEGLLEKNSAGIALFQSWYEHLNGLLFLELNSKGLEEVILHNCTKLTYKIRDQRVFDDTDFTQEEIQAALEVLCLKNNINWNYATPFTSFKTIIHGHKVRVTLTHHHLSANGESKAFIRLLKSDHLSIQDFGQYLPEEKLSQMIKNKKNILLAGATGSGKTSFLNTLLKETSEKEHLIILEDTEELNSPHLNTTRLVSVPDHKEANLNSYLKYAMRMSPERIVLGEMRSAEVEPYLLAMNSGHSGVLSTIHANSAKDAVSRLALLFKIYSNKDLSYELILKLICENLDYVVFLKNKEVTEVINIFGSETDNIFYENIDLKRPQIEALYA